MSEQLVVNLHYAETASQGDFVDKCKDIIDQMAESNIEVGDYFTLLEGGFYIVEVGQPIQPAGAFLLPASLWDITFFMYLLEYEGQDVERGIKNIAFVEGVQPPDDWLAMGSERPSKTQK